MIPSDEEIFNFLENLSTDVTHQRTAFEMAKSIGKWLREKDKESREIVEDLCQQFAYEGRTINGNPSIWTGGLSALESAFSFLGWEDPHPSPERKCEIEGCPHHATCGGNTEDGYKRLCSVCFHERSK